MFNPLSIPFLFGNKKGEYHSHWSNLVPSFTYPTEKFYEQLTEKVMSSEIKGMRTKVVKEKKGNAFSASRLYLRVSYKEYNYYVCIAPFGEGTFMSTWLYYKQRKREMILNLIPVIGEWLCDRFFPKTMYRIDTASMYMTYCHDAMTKILDEITKDMGFRLHENDRKPTVKDVFKR